MEPTDMDLREASTWWDPAPTTLTLYKHEAALVREALELLDASMTEDLKRARPVQEAHLRRSQGDIAELLLKLGA